MKFICAKIRLFLYNSFTIISRYGRGSGSGSGTDGNNLSTVRYTMFKSSSLTRDSENEKFTRFSNFKKLFSFKSLCILCVTILLSFLIRLFIVKFFNFDMTLFRDFFITGFLVSLIRPIITDLFEIYFQEYAVLSEVKELPGNYYNSRNNNNGMSNQSGNLNNMSRNDKSSSNNLEDKSNVKYILKQRIF